MRLNYQKLGLGLLTTGAALLLADAWIGEKFRLETRHFLIGKRDGKNRLRIVLLSDLHFKRHFWPFHQKLVNKISQLKPDVMMISGDVIDEHGRPEPAYRFFNSLSPHVPKVAIPGNHDNKNQVSRQTLRDIVEHNNGRLLVNETIQLVIKNTPLTITGLDDFIESESCFADAVKGISKEKHHFLLIHSPLQQESVRKEMQRINESRTADQQLAIQYMFAGHTHGGQVRLGKFVPILPEASGGYINGWYNQDKPYLYVSKGFGTSTLPFRFGAKPEITVFDYGF